MRMRKQLPSIVTVLMMVALVSPFAAAGYSGRTSPGITASSNTLVSLADPQSSQKKDEEPGSNTTKKKTPKPTNTAEPTNTPKPTKTEEPTKTPKPTKTEEPTKTPKPTNTPKPMKKKV